MQLQLPVRRHPGCRRRRRRRRRVRPSRAADAATLREADLNIQIGLTTDVCTVDPRSGHLAEHTTRWNDQLGCGETVLSCVLHLGVDPHTLEDLSPRGAAQRAVAQARSPGLAKRERTLPELVGHLRFSHVGSLADFGKTPLPLSTANSWLSATFSALSGSYSAENVALNASWLGERRCWSAGVGSRWARAPRSSARWSASTLVRRSSGAVPPASS